MEARVLGGLLAAGAIVCSVAEAQLTVTKAGSTLKLAPMPTATGVTSVVVQASGAGQIFLSWAPVANATSYKVWGDGLPLTGQDANPGGLTKLGRYQNPNLSIGGLSGPGMGTWSIGAYLDPAVASSTPLTPVTKVSHWITGASGLQEPRMPAPTYLATRFDIGEGAWNDAYDRAMYTNFPMDQTCPQAMYVSLDGGAEPVLAAGKDLGVVTDQLQYLFPNLNGALHFRAPKVASITAAPAGNNAWIYAINCRGEYSNALPFKIWPGDLHVERANPDNAGTPAAATICISTCPGAPFYGGQMGTITGGGMKGTYTNITQSVMLEVIGKRATGEQVTFTTEAQTYGAGEGDERSVRFYAPSLTSGQYGVATLIDAKVFVVRRNPDAVVESNRIPICYRENGDGLQVMNYGGC
jgi:hypothetical protein